MLYLNAALNYTFNGLGVPVDLSHTATFTTLIETPPPSSEGTSQLTSPSGYNWSITLTPSPCSAFQQTQSESAQSSAEAIYRMWWVYFYVVEHSLHNLFVFFCCIHLAGYSTPGGLSSEMNWDYPLEWLKGIVPFSKLVLFSLQYNTNPNWCMNSKSKLFLVCFVWHPPPVPPLLPICSKVWFACSSSDWIKPIVPQKEIDGKAG